MPSWCFLFAQGLHWSCTCWPTPRRAWSRPQWPQWRCPSPLLPNLDKFQLSLQSGVGTPCFSLPRGGAFQGGKQGSIQTIETGNGLKLSLSGEFCWSTYHSSVHSLNVMHRCAKVWVVTCPGLWQSRVMQFTCWATSPATCWPSLLSGPPRRDPTRNTHLVSAEQNPLALWAPLSLFGVKFLF